VNSRLAGCLIALSLTVAAPAALAQTDFDRTTARSLGQEGHEALDRRDYAAAADRFSRADALVHAPTFLLGYAQAEVGLGKLVAALEAYNRILRQGVDPKAPPAFVKALETARQEFDALQPRIPYVTVQVDGPAAASVKVTIDGVDLARAALGVKRAVDPGNHVIVATADGFLPANATVVVAEGRTEVVTLSPKPGGSPGVTPSAQGGPVDTTRRTIGIAAMAVGGAGLLVGAIMGGAEIAKHSSLEKSCPNGKCPLSEQPALQSQVNQFHAFGTASTVGFVAGGALAATGLILFFTAPKPSAGQLGLAPGGPASVGLAIGPTRAAIEGSF